MTGSIGVERLSWRASRRSSSPGSTAPRVALIEGQPGVGKTTLWSAAIEHARDMRWRVLGPVRPMPRRRSRMRVSETSWSVPDDALADLPGPQRRALRVALLREEPEGPDPDPRAVAVACLNTLRSLSADGHVVVAVDDIVARPGVGAGHGIRDASTRR